jgi:hypothetical protein
MTLLFFLNFFLLQWFFIRLARVIDTNRNKQIGWTLIFGIVPLTGWYITGCHTNYKYIIRTGGFRIERLFLEGKKITRFR